MYRRDSAQASLAEIALGQAAQTHSGNAMMTMFGQMMVLEHGFQYQAAAQVSKSVHLPVPTATDPVRAKILALSSQLYGGGFDCS